MQHSWDERLRTYRASDSFGRKYEECLQKRIRASGREEGILRNPYLVMRGPLPRREALSRESCLFVIVGAIALSVYGDGGTSGGGGGGPG